MAEENGENGSVNGDVPEIELIIKVKDSFGHISEPA